MANEPVRNAALAAGVGFLGLAAAVGELNTKPGGVTHLCYRVRR